MQKVFNKRPALYMGIATILGTALGAAIWDSIAFVAVSASVIFALGTVTLIFKKRFVSLICLFCLLGFTLATVEMNILNVDIEAENVSITARVYSVLPTDKNNEYRIEDITVDGKSVKYNGVFTGEFDIDEGDIICIEGDIKTYKLNPFLPYTMGRYGKRIRYNIKPDTVKLTNSGLPTLTEKTKKSIIEIIGENSGSEGGTAIAIILGERHYMDDETYENMQNLGIAHIFAVSGLHVMTVAAAVYGLLRLLKVSRKISHVAVLGLVVFYGALAGFSASVIRAIIMIGVSVFAELTERPPDLLSRLSLAAIISVFIRPLCVFEMGFQLSYASVAGIAFLAAPFSRKIQNKIGRKTLGKILAAIAYAAAINIFLLPITLADFGTVGLFAIPANIVLIPLVSVAYIVAIAGVAICLIFPSLGSVIPYVCYPFKLFADIASAIATLPVSNISYSLNPWGALVFMAGLIILSPMLKIKKMPRFSLASGTFAVGVVLATLL